MTTAREQYILVGQTPVLCEDILEWARWFENAASRIVRQDRLFKGEVLVSTVFLGVDHSFNLVLGEDGPPILFETMTFDKLNLLPEVQQRCSEWLEAEAQHRAVLTKVSGDLKAWKMRLRRTVRRFRNLWVACLRVARSSALRATSPFRSRAHSRTTG